MHGRDPNAGSGTREERQQAQARGATDSLAKDGRLKVEIHPWLTMKGNLRDPEFSTAPARQTP